MSVILFVDTAATHTQVALAKGDNVLSVVLHEQANEQAKVLNTLIESQLKQQDLHLNDVDAIAVDAGPGSYTGLRVGLGVAKGLCFALDKPILLFNRLELLSGNQNDALIVLKARVGEGFAMAKRHGNLILEPNHIFYDQFDWHAFEDISILTDDESLLQQFSHSKAITDTVLDIELWNEMAQKRMEQKAFDDLAYAEPFYLKSAFTTASKKKI